MPFLERLDSFADIQALVGEERKIKEIVKNVTADIAKLSKEARGIFNDFGGGSTLAELVKNTNAAANAQKNMEQATKELLLTQRAATEAAKQATEATKQQFNASKSATESAKQGTETAKQAAIAKQADAKATTEQTKAQIILQKETERLEKLAEKESQAVKKKQSEYGMLNKQYKDAAELAKNLGAEQFRLQQELSGQKAQYATGGIFSGVSASDIAAKEAKIAELTPKLKEAQAAALKLSEGLYGVEIAVGQGQRKVGQYSMAAQGLKDILRDTPAFAYSMATGISAISNNIPTLTDGIATLIKNNKELKAQGLETVPVWKQLGKELFSIPNILAIATTAIVIIAAQWKNLRGEIDKTDESIKKYKDAIKDVDSKAAVDSQNEITRMKLLAAQAADTKKSMDARLAAVQELQNKYPEYLGNLDKEKILNGDIKKEIDGVTEAIMKKAMAAAAMKKYEEASSAEYEIYLSQKKALQELAKAEANLAKASNRKGGVGDEFAGDVTMQQAAVNRAQAALDDLVKKRNAIRTEMRGYLADAQANDLGFPKPTQDKQTDGKSAKAEITSYYDALKKLAEAEALLAKERIDRDSEAQKAIMDNNDNALSAKLEAMQKYYSDVEAMRAVDYDKDIAIEKESISANKMKLAKVKDLTAEERKALEILIKASQTKMLGLEGKYRADIAGIRNDAGKKEAAIIKADIEKNFQSIETAYQQQKNSEEMHYLNDLLKLREQFDKKEISLKDYQDKAMNMTHLFNMEIENADIQHYKALLQQDNLTNEERLNVLRKLGEAVKKLGDETKKAPENLTAWQQFFKIFTGSSSKDADAIGGAITELSNLAMEAESALLEMSNQRYQNELDQLERKKQMISDVSEKEIAAIQNALMSDQEKEIKIGEIKAKQAQQNDEIHRQEIANKRAMAINDKVANVSAIIERGLLAEVSALQYLANPVTAPLYPFIAGLIATTSGIAAAKALTTPIPSYAEGTDNHPGGMARYGEAGPEVVREPGKAPYLVDKETIGYLPAGTQVLPVSDIVGSASGMMTASLIRGLANGNIIVASDSAPVVSSINALKSEISDVKNAIMSKQEVHFHWKNGELRKGVKRGGSWVDYLNNI